MDSFFKNRAVINKKGTEEGDETDETARGALASLPDVSSKGAPTSEEASCEETCEILNADEEGYKVEVVKVNDEITKIIVNCPCGKALTLNCEYAPPPEKDT